MENVEATWRDMRFRAGRATIPGKQFATISCSHCDSHLRFASNRGRPARIAAGPPARAPDVVAGGVPSCSGQRDEAALRAAAAEARQTRAATKAHRAWISHYLFSERQNSKFAHDLIFSNSFLSNNRSCCDKAGLYEGEAITIAIDFSAFQFSTRRLNVTDA